MPLQRRSPAITHTVHRLDFVKRPIDHEEFLANALQVRGDRVVIHRKFRFAHELVAVFHMPRKFHQRMDHPKFRHRQLHALLFPEHRDLVDVQSKIAAMKHIFCGNAGETYFSTSDIGWVVGHSYIVYGPLIAGMATILYEGLPIRPDAAVWWSLVERHKVSVMFSSPTAIRVLKKQDPDFSSGATQLLAGVSLGISGTFSGKYRGKHPRIVYEEALFGEAECQREQKNYRDASDTYTKLLLDFPHTQYTRPACKSMFEIANHWLRPTSAQMDEYFEKLQGKRSFVMPTSYIHLGRDMPFMDAEGHATNLLNVVRLYDINGPLAEQALWCLGTIQFYRKDYKEADFYFRQVYEQYPNSDFAGRAVKQSVICKQLISGDTEYDSRSVEESKKLLMQAQGSFPELKKDEKWISTQLASMNIHQADRDFKVAEFYERTGHPGSAYFYYELVCRRYGGTQYAEKAAQKKALLKSKADQEQRRDRNDAVVPTANAVSSPVLQSPVTPPGPNTLPPSVSVPRP